MTTMKKNLFWLAGLCAMPFFITSCDDDNGTTTYSNSSSYVLSLGVTGTDGVTVYYVVSTDSLTSGTISANGNGIEQTGYHDYQKGSNTIFCIGGMGVTECTGIVRADDGNLEENGSFVFTNSLSGLTQIDNNTMLGVEIPANAEAGDKFTFYTIDANTLEITNKNTSVSVSPLSDLDWPSLTGFEYSNGYVYLSYCPMNSSTFDTNYTDNGYVAVFSYPELKLVNHIVDSRTGNIGSWNAYNGFMKDEQGDLYLLSNSNIVNGYSQTTKGASFTRIKSGATDVDEDYFFDFSEVTNGMSPSHVIYCGNGIAYAEVCTLNAEQQAEHRWSDTGLKGMIVDLYNKTAVEVEGIPIHDGDGGRRFAALYDNGYVYFRIGTSEGNYLYQVDVKNATAIRGAKVSATFVAGFFAL